MNLSRILNLAHYGQTPTDISPARWAAMVKQAKAEHQWLLANSEAYGHTYEP